MATSWSGSGSRPGSAWSGPSRPASAWGGPGDPTTSWSRPLDPDTDWTPEGADPWTQWGGRPGFLKGWAEELTASEAATQEMSGRVQRVTEQLTASGSPLRAEYDSRAGSESAAVAESWSRSTASRTVARQLAEQLTASELPSLSRVTDVTKTWAEALTASEASAFAETLDLADVESISINEGWTRTPVPRNYLKRIVESFSASELGSLLEFRNIPTSSESGSLGESWTRTADPRNQVKQIAEQLTASEVGVLAELLDLATAEVSALAESWTRTPDPRNQVKQIAEPLTATELGALTAIRPLSEVETAALAESWSRSTPSRTTSPKQVTESLTATESGDLAQLKEATGLSMFWDGLCRAELTWADQSTGEDGYKVYRDSVEIADLPANSQLYRDSGASASTTHTWEVAAYSGSVIGPKASLTDTTGTCPP